ncbi:MAG TPA: hypothetical protein VKV73_14260 [Chloroflexota bacterium]|nr:hypothetical protein [Chloroflexota bacterium]
MTSQYVGCGPVALLSARLDATQRQEQAEQRAHERARLHAAEARYRPLDHQLEEVCDVAETLAKLALLTAGYHQHNRGHWRRRRANG